MVEHPQATNPKDDATNIEAKNLMRRNDQALSMTRPLYQLGDLVCITSETEDGLLTDMGYITGVEIDPPHASPGWWYAVCIVGDEWANMTEWLPQDQIVGRVIHGGYGYGV